MYLVFFFFACQRVAELEAQGAASSAEAERLRAALQAAEARIAELEALLETVKSQPQPTPPSTPTKTPPATPEKSQSKRNLSTAHLAEQKQQLQPADEGSRYFVFNTAYLSSLDFLFFPSLPSF